MKKIIIGLVAVAAMGALVYCFANSTSSEILTENVNALSDAHCAYDPGRNCFIRWLDGDGWYSHDYVKVGKDEMDMLEDLIRIIN